jgi:hypothetical protein
MKRVFFCVGIIICACSVFSIILWDGQAGKQDHFIRSIPRFYDKNSYVFGSSFSETQESGSLKIIDRTDGHTRYSFQTESPVFPCFCKDIDNDGESEIVAVLAQGPVQVFKVIGGTLKMTTSFSPVFTDLPFNVTIQDGSIVCADDYMDVFSAGDRILKVQGRDVLSWWDIMQILKDMKKGEYVTVNVLDKNSKIKRSSVELTENEDYFMAPSSFFCDSAEWQSDRYVISASMNGFIYLWDYLGNIVSRVYIGYEYYSVPPQPVDINYDGKYELLMTSFEGVSTLLDASGEILWQFELGDDIFSLPLICDINSDGDFDIVYCTLSGKVIYSDKFGNARLISELKSRVLSNPAASDLYLSGIINIITADESGKMSIFDPDGNLVKQKEIPSEAFFSSPLVIGLYDNETAWSNKIFLVSSSGKVYRYDTLTDELKFKADIIDTCSANVVIDDVDIDGVAELLIPCESGDVKAMQIGEYSRLTPWTEPNGDHFGSYVSYINTPLKVAQEFETFEASDIRSCSVAISSFFRFSDNEEYVFSASGSIFYEDGESMYILTSLSACGIIPVMTKLNEQNFSYMDVRLKVGDQRVAPDSIYINRKLKDLCIMKVSKDRIKQDISPASLAFSQSNAYELYDFIGKRSIKVGLSESKTGYVNFFAYEYRDIISEEALLGGSGIFDDAAHICAFIGYSPQGQKIAITADEVLESFQAQEYIKLVYSNEKNNDAVGGLLKKIAGYYGIYD